ANTKTWILRWKPAFRTICSPSWHARASAPCPNPTDSVPVIRPGAKTSGTCGPSADTSASTRPRSTGAPPPDPAATVPGQAHVVAIRRARGCAHGGAARAVKPWTAERLPHEPARPSRSRAVPRGQARVVAIRRARGCAHGGAARAVEPWRAERLPHQPAQPSRSRAVPRGQARVVAIRRARGCAHGGVARAVKPW